MVFSRYIPRNGTAGYMEVLVLVFKETSILFSMAGPVAAPVYIPSSEGGFLLSTLSPAFAVCRVFDNDLCDQCEAIPCCSFGLNFSNNWGCWACACYLWKNIYLDSLLIFWLGYLLILSCLKSSCIFEINPLSIASSANIFSCSLFFFTQLDLGTNSVRSLRQML